MYNKPLQLSKYIIEEENGSFKHFNEDRSQ